MQQVLEKLVRKPKLNEKDFFNTSYHISSGINLKKCVKILILIKNVKIKLIDTHHYKNI